MKAPLGPGAPVTLRWVPAGPDLMAAPVGNRDGQWMVVEEEVLLGLELLLGVWVLH